MCPQMSVKIPNKKLHEIRLAEVALFRADGRKERQTFTTNSPYSQFRYNRVQKRNVKQKEKGLHMITYSVEQSPS
jgi:hypothetical protein